MTAEGQDQNTGTAEFTIEHLPDLHRFVLSRADDELAHLEYVVREGVWVITHTFTEPTARGAGLAAKVTVAALDGARSAGVLIWPVCPYVVDYVAVHPEYDDLVAQVGRSSP